MMHSTMYTKGPSLHRVLFIAPETVSRAKDGIRPRVRGQQLWLTVRDIRLFPDLGDTIRKIGRRRWRGSETKTTRANEVSLGAPRTRVSATQKAKALRVHWRTCTYRTSVQWQNMDAFWLSNFVHICTTASGHYSSVSFMQMKPHRICRQRW